MIFSLPNRIMHTLKNICIAAFIPKNMRSRAISWGKKSGWIAFIFLSLTIITLWTIAPFDQEQGSYMRILYVHVPMCWGALCVYTAMAIFSGLGLVMRMPQSFLIAKALAPIGATYCFVSLITGSLWGKPTWGTFWVWDARLTSMLILFFMYIVYLYLSRGRSLHHMVPSALLALIGWVNIPIIKGSVEWWYTLHQPATFRLLSRQSTMDLDMAIPLVCAVIFLVSYTVFLTSRRVYQFFAQR